MLTDTSTSIFNRVLGLHEQTVATEALAVRSRADALANSHALFLTAFRDAVESVARPIFARFVEDAAAAGFTARIDDNLAHALRPSIALFVNPRKGKADATPSDNASYELAALVGVSQVEHISHFDLRANDRGHRINPDGTKKFAFGVASIDRETIEREVEEFWTLSLRARKGE